MHLKADVALDLSIGLMCVVGSGSGSGIEEDGDCIACRCCTSIGHADVIKSNDAVAERSKAQR